MVGVVRHMLAGDDISIAAAHGAPFHRPLLPSSSGDRFGGVIMIINRRTLLAAASGLAVWPALAEEAPPALAAYERATGGRIGLYAENLTTGAKLAWRADERF